MISITAERPDSVDAVELLSELDAQLQSNDYPQESRHAFSIEKLIKENVAFFVLRYEGQAVACGGVKLFGTEYGEVKRMYVRPAFRGRGFGRQILNRLVGYSQDYSVNVLRLETGIHQTEAILLYERYGFQRRSPFGEYKEDPMSIYFEKSIG